MEGCTWASVSDGPYAAAMGLDNRTRECQAHPGALGFRRKERVEYAFKVFRRQPYAGIADRNCSGQGNPAGECMSAHGRIQARSIGTR
jgi:hypothetical protein